MTSIGGNISNLLGFGSGLDTSALVSSLVSAARTPKETVLNNRITLNNTRISALASAKSSLDAFSAALTDTLKSSDFSGQPVSNDPSIVAVSLIAGGVPKGLPAQIEVRQLAAGQTLESVSLAGASTPVGLGTLTLTTASGPHAITITGLNNTLGGLAAEINNADAGVTATVVTDNRGSRLVLKGATGDANAFTLTNSGDADIDLQRFTFNGTTGGMTKKQDAQDSIVFIDNVEMQNDSNVLKSAIPFVRIDLNKAAPGTLVTLASNEPTSSMKDLVTEFVAAYNTLRSALNSATAVGKTAAESGALAGDPAARAMLNQLSRLTTTPLATSGPYKTLGDLGVKTFQDGTLLVDTARLDAAIAADPAAVTQLLNPSAPTPTNPGIAGAVKAVVDNLEQDGGVLKADQTKYESLKKELAKQLDKLNSDMTDYEERLSVVYTKMDAQLSAFKATQSYLEQQVKMWTNSKE